MASAPVAFEVFLFDRGRFVGSRVFSGDRQVSIGRARDATLRLDDPLVSGRHAVLFVKDGGLHIADDGSSNGVFVNGRHVTSAEIGPLDEIRLGDSRIKVEAIGDDAADGIPAPERTHAGLELPAGFLETAASTSPPPSIKLSPELSTGSGGAPLPLASPAAQAGPAAPPRRQAGVRGHEPLHPAPAAAKGHEPLHPAPAAAKGHEPSHPAPAAAKGHEPSHPAPAPAAATGHEQPLLLPADTGVAAAIPSKPSAPGTSMRGAAPPSKKPDGRKREQPAAPPPPPKGGSASNIAAMLQETNEALAKSSEPKAPTPKQTPAAEELRSESSDPSLPYPPSPPEVDEEAAEESRFVSPFSLLEALVVDSGDPGAGAVPIAEVLRHRGDRLVDAARLEVGGTYDIHRGEEGKPWRMLQVLRKGRIRLFFKEGDEGSLLVGGKKASLPSLCDPAHLFHKKRGIYAVDLTESDRAQLWIDGAGYYVRWARAPLPPPKRFSFKVGAEDRRYALTGVAGIVLMLLGIWLQSLLAPPELLVMEQAEFAEISLKDLEMEKPPEPEPELPKPPEPVAEVQAPEPQPVKQAPTPQPRSNKAAKVAASPNPQPSAPAPTAADNALAALADIIPAGDTKLTAAVSNIAAVRVPTGTSSSFQVSGAIGKVPGDEVTLSRGGKAGGEGRETRAAAAVLAGKSVGQVAGGGGTGKVRGTVARQPTRSVGTAGGSLDRGAILKVINEGIAEVQSCYERQLIANPGLQGKVVFDWEISPEGAVSSTRVRSSSLASQAAATCIASVIKSWRFPKPTGGSVTVTFPFVFSVQGF